MTALLIAIALIATLALCPLLGFVALLLVALPFLVAQDLWRFVRRDGKTTIGAFLRGYRAEHEPPAPTHALPPAPRRVRAYVLSERVGEGVRFTEHRNGLH